MNKPTVLLLAGGVSKRFWPFEDKQLLSFFGKPLLYHQLERLQKAGFVDIVVVARGNTLAAAQNFGVTSIEQNGEGMAHAVLSAESVITDKSLMVVIGNDVTSLELYQTMFEKIQGNPPGNFLVGYKTNRYLPMGYVGQENGRVVDIIEKPGEGKTPGNYITMGVHVFSNGSQVVSYLKKAKSSRDDLYERALSNMMKEEVFQMIPYEGSFAYLKYPWHTLLVMNHFLETIRESFIAKTAQIHKTATIVGPVVIEDGVVVMEYAKIVGPCYIGPNSIVGNHTMIRRSHIGRDSVIGFGSDVTRSYIGALTWLHTNYIGDSVTGDNVSMGSGTVLANLRLDEKEIYSEIKNEKISTQETKCGALIGNNVRIGVNASIMPGVKIGKDSFVGAGIVLAQDLPDGMRCFLNQEVTIKKQNTIHKTADRSVFRKKI